MAKEKSKAKKTIKGCEMVICEDPITGEIRLFPKGCPTGYAKKLRSKMREKGIKVSPEPFPEDLVLSIPEDE